MFFNPLSLFGIRLQLFVGANIPTPVSDEVIDALLNVEVTNNDRERDGFQLDISLGKSFLADYKLLQDGLFDPPNRVIIMVIVGFTPQVLIDGIITDHQVVPSNEPGRTRLHVTGQDISLKLDLEEKNVTYPNQGDSSIAQQIVTKYDLTPRITPTTDTPTDTERVPTQQGTDLSYIQLLAQRNGFVFYIEPVVPLANVAYWGPENRLGLPQPALTMNMGSDTNVDMPINFHFNALGPATPQVSIIDPFTKVAIPIPIPSDFIPSLTSKTATPLRTTVSRDTAGLTIAQALLRVFSTLSQSADTVVATGEIDAVRYGRALQARRLVGLRGAGNSYNGTYYVKQVVHRIKRGEYKQSFTLTRDGRGASGSSVVP